MGNRKAETTSDWLFEALSRDIINGDLAPKEKISEPAIARRFGISRAPVREAIRRMEERRLVIRKPRSGCRVADFSFDNLLEIFEIREVLEGVACRLAAGRMDDRTIAELKDSLAHQLDLSCSGQPFTAEHITTFHDFHYHIARSSGNVALTRLLCEDYYTLIKVYRNRFTWMGPESERTWSIREHLHIMEAIEARDGEFAEIVMRRHIAGTVAKFRQMYQETKTM